MPFSPPFDQPAWKLTEDPKRGLQRAPEETSRNSRESADSRGADGLGDSQAFVWAGPGTSTSALGGSTLVGVMASPPPGRSQALPLQAKRRTVGMNYNCSIRTSLLLRLRPGRMVWFPRIGRSRRGNLSALRS